MRIVKALSKNHIRDIALRNAQPIFKIKYMLHQSIKDLLEKNNVVEINPVHENFRNSRVMGYHYACTDKDQWLVMKGIKKIILDNKLEYSLSQYNGKGDFILFLNN